MTNADLTNTPEPALGAPVPVAPGEWGTRSGLAEYARGRHPGTVSLMRYFAFAHLAGPLRAVSEPFARLACDLLDMLPDSPEFTTALRNLVASKDNAVRAHVDTLDP